MKEANKPTVGWLEEFKTMDVDSMLMELLLMGDDDFVRAADEFIHGPIGKEGE